MPETAHGTRCAYQAGCTCFRCRLANATYARAIRARHRANLPPLGSRISAVETWRKIRQLQADRFTKAEIARRLGFQTPNLRFQRDVITLRNALKVQRICRELML